MTITFMNQAIAAALLQRMERILEEEIEIIYDCGVTATEKFIHNPEEHDKAIQEYKETVARVKGIDDTITEIKNFLFENDMYNTAFTKETHLAPTMQKLRDSFNKREVNNL